MPAPEPVPREQGQVRLRAFLKMAVAALTSSLGPRPALAKRALAGWGFTLLVAIL